MTKNIANTQQEDNSEGEICSWGIFTELDKSKRSTLSKINLTSMQVSMF